MNAGRSSSKEQSIESRWAVFVDRDGTIIDETGYLSDPDGVRILPHASSGLRKLNRIGIPVIVVSNQSGIARRMFTAEDVERVNQRMRDLLAADGARVDAIYFCPHHPDYDVECDCRKPRPGLLVAASKERGISLKESFMVGDKLIDMQAGRAAETSTVFVRTGDGQKELQAAGAEISAVADAVCEDLSEAVEWILEQRNLRR
ncbi:MAG: HAD family hydrolase [Candidatus Eisenbacteria bacterium]|nr:HAD family hydrolase [Candidatus Eisenbacteria bacterium]